jgi:hypothetical protein
MLDMCSLTNVERTLEKNPFAPNLVIMGRSSFRRRTKDEFIEFLDSVESTMSPDHLSMVNGLYGEDWAEPFTSLFTKNDAS